MISLSEWIDIKTNNGDINYFEYSEFSNVEKVGEGAFGIVNRADWNSGGIKVALKIFANNLSINEDNMKNFLKELNNLRRVSFHPNINRFFGITKDPSNNYIMVLQYASQGNLREYLKRSFNSLQWRDKVIMAKDITCGLKCLHSRKIIHRDLHAKNILVHNNKLMIGDFGLSKQLTVEVTSKSNSIDFGMPAYVDPQYYKNDKYVRDKKSDIYSLGILLWEITSGYPPLSEMSVNRVYYKVTNGFREQPITDTPLDYVNLYQKCWDDDPNSRPTIDDVFNILEVIYSQLNINRSGSNPKITEGLQSNPTNNKISTPDLFSVVNENERKLLDEIIQAYLNHNKIGWTKSFHLDEVLAKYELKSKEIFNYLINNPTVQHYEVIVGRFYRQGFGISMDKNIAFELYMKASQRNDAIGHFEVGCCYYCGDGVEKNYKKAFKFYQRAADNGLNIALHNLAHCYNVGYGIQKDEFRAFELYRDSAKNGFIPSQFELAKRYKYGEGTHKNKQKALKWYKSYQKNDGHIDISYNIKILEQKVENQNKKSWLPSFKFK